LFGEVAEGEPGLQSFENTDGLAVVLIHHRFFRGLVGFPNVLHGVIRLGIARAARQQNGQEK
jgi:hypothetical protein